MGYIYILTSPNGKSYIGQTARLIKTRLEEHRTGQSNGCRAIYNAIKKHGWENFEKDWYECPDEDLNKHEELMVEVLGTLAPGGYNLRKGGGSHGEMSEESKQKMSEAQRGEKHPMCGKTLSDGHKQKIGEAQRGEKHHMWGKSHREESREKMSEAKKGEKHPMYGKTHNEETRGKMSEANIGKIVSEETKQKISEALCGEKHHKSKRVYQYALDGTFISSFGSTEEAGRYIKKAGTCIRACARGKYNTAYGFKWSYENSM